MKVEKFETQIRIEPHASHPGSKLNWLRAAVLGANDGIVSIAGLVLGVAAATSSKGIIFTAGLAGIIAGAISMAVGEYVSVSSARDTEKALLKKEEEELENFPEEELAELAEIYERKGLSKKTAAVVAAELTAHDAFAAHVDAELRMDPDNLTDPNHASFASAASFLGGALIPLVAILIPPAQWSVPVAFVSVVIALIITGTLSAKVGGAKLRPAIVRVVTGGVVAMVITFAVGRIFGIKL